MTLLEFAIEFNGLHGFQTAIFRSKITGSQIWDGFGTDMGNPYLDIWIFMRKKQSWETLSHMLKMVVRYYP